jgi:hypothetical protein
MEQQVIIICRTCEDRNKAMLGMPNYIEQDTEYESLTRAFEHMAESNDGHDLYMVVR